MKGPSDHMLQLAYKYTRGLSAKEEYRVWMHLWNGGKLWQCKTCGLISVCWPKYSEPKI